MQQPRLDESVTTKPQPYHGRYSPKRPDPYKISRSKIELFLECPRCFYIDRRLGIARPPSFPFNLNKAVDTLLKKEFDIHRAKSTPHPLMKAYKIEAVPFAHDHLDAWRDTFAGIQYLHQPTNLLVYGAIDDVWQAPSGELLVVDYKATSKNGEVNIDADWQIVYKRQLEVYQWLLRRNDFPVSDTGYFVYANGKSDARAFDGKLEFDVKVIPYTGSDDWIEPTIKALYRCLNQAKPPPANEACEFCHYSRARRRQQL